MKLLNSKIYYVLMLLGCFLFPQDPPGNFEYNQSTQQAFYFFLDINILGEELEAEDWIGAFNSYDETLGGECTQEEINTDETLGGMCYSIPVGQSEYNYFCNTILWPKFVTYIMSVLGC